MVEIFTVENQSVNEILCHTLMLILGILLLVPCPCHSVYGRFRRVPKNISKPLSNRTGICDGLLIIPIVGKLHFMRGLLSLSQNRGILIRHPSLKNCIGK